MFGCEAVDLDFLNTAPVRLIPPLTLAAAERGLRSVCT